MATHYFHRTVTAYKTAKGTSYTLTHWVSGQIDLYIKGVSFKGVTTADLLCTYTEL